MDGGTHVGYGCLVADWEVDEFDFGHRCTVVDCDRRCIRVGECNALGYGCESGVVGFSVDWRVGRGSRHVGYGCLVADQGDDQCGLGHGRTVVDCDQ